MQLNRFVMLLAAVMIWGVASAAQAQANSAAWPSPIHDNTIFSKWMLDRLEYRDSKNNRSGYWEGQAWIGTDINKLWLKTEGSRVHGKTDDAELEAYYSRAVAPFWDAQVGLRHEFSTTDMPSRDWLGVGFQGLAPYLFELDATAYVGNHGRTALRFKGEYELLLTQRWVFMPEVELNAYGKKDLEKMRGSGLSDASLTLRIRYEIRREFAPYVGVMWTQKYGGTADIARAAGDPVSETFLLAGVRIWW